MKCTAKVIFGHRTKGKSTKEKQLGYVQEQFHDNLEEYLSPWKKEGYTITRISNLCEGKIIAEVRAEDEPYYGGTSANLVVNFTCDRCGCTYFKDLPNESSISEFLTNVVENL